MRSSVSKRSRRRGKAVRKRIPVPAELLDSDEFPPPQEIDHLWIEEGSRGVQLLAEDVDRKARTILHLNSG